MIHWSAIGAGKTEVESVDPVGLDPSPGNAPPVEQAVEPPADTGAAPPLSRAGREAGPAVSRPRRARRAGWTATAIVVSTAVHAAAIVLLADRMARNGIEAADKPVSVEIVLEGTKPAPRPAIAGAVAQSPSTAAETLKPIELPGDAAVPATPATPEEAKAPTSEGDTARTAEPGTKRHETAESARPHEPIRSVEPAKSDTPVEANKQSPLAPVENASRPTETREAASSVAPRAAEASPPDQSRIAELAAPPTVEPLESEPVPPIPEAEIKPSEDAAQVPLPTESIPVPTPRPDPPAPRTTSREPEAKADPTRHTDEHAKARPAAKASAKSKAKSATRSQPAPQAGRKGGATAGEKAAYARKLVRHVERYKRYPKAAERKGISGATGLSITIDRAGGLTGARLAKGSGQAMLDEEALAVARRAAPYPRPPQGIGGSTLSFTVTLRFSR